MMIGMLYDYPQFIDTVIKWLNHEFGDEKSIHFYKDIIEHSLDANKIPITFVAVERGELLGTVGIWRGDLLSRQDLFPWLSALVVNPQYRNIGIGQEMQKYALQYCESKGLKEIYLYTELVGYYEKAVGSYLIPDMNIQEIKLGFIGIVYQITNNNIYNFQFVEQIQVCAFL